MGKRGDTIKNNRNIAVIKAPDGNNVVIINDIRFKGKRSIDWNDVKNYLKEYIGDVYTIADTKEIVYIDVDKEKAAAQALDLYDSSTYLAHHANVWAGTYEDIDKTCKSEEL